MRTSMKAAGARSMREKIKNWYLSGGGSSVTSEYEAVLNRATALGYALPSASQQINQNAFVLALKAANILTELDLLYVFANDVAGNFWKLNWINPTLYEITEPAGVLTKTSNVGINGNGSSTYANTNWISATNAVKYQLNNSSVIMYVANNVSEAKYACGSVGVSETTIAPRWTDNNFYGVINAASSSFNTYSNLNSTGLYQMTRAASNNMKLFKGGVQVDTEARTSSSHNSNPMWICARNPGSFSTYQVSFFAVGSNLEDKAAALNSAWESFFLTL